MLELSDVLEVTRVVVRFEVVSVVVDVVLVSMVDTSLVVDASFVVDASVVVDVSVVVDTSVVVDPPSDPTSIHQISS